MSLCAEALKRKKQRMRINGLRYSVIPALSEKRNRDHLERLELKREINGLCFFQIDHCCWVRMKKIPRELFEVPRTRGEAMGSLCCGESLAQWKVFWVAMVGISNVVLDSQPRFEELTNLIRTIRNAMKIRDVTKCLEEFELLGKAYGKAKSIVDKEGVPRFYIRILADLEDYLNEVWVLWVRGNPEGDYGAWGLFLIHFQESCFFWVVCLCTVFPKTQEMGIIQGEETLLAKNFNFFYIASYLWLCTFSGDMQRHF